MSTHANSAPTALGGLRVLEISDMISAPFCGKLLASLGAEVIKIEPPKTGDSSRRRGPFPDDVPHLERSGLFLYLNTGKKSITLNLDDLQGQKILWELTAKVDVLVHDLAPSRAKGLGLGQDRLAGERPDLVVSAITPYGSTGPYSEYQANDLNIFHAGGEGNLLPNGLALDVFPDRAPLAAGSNMGSYQGGLSGAVGVCGAIYAKWGGSPGQFVDCSTQEAELTIGYMPLQRLESEGVEEDRFTRFFRVGGVMPTLDGHIELLTLEPRQWENLWHFLGDPDWAAPEKFADPTTYGPEINRNLREWTADKTKDWLYHNGQAAGVPFAPFYTPGEVFQSPHQRERGFFISVEHPEAGTYDYAGPPYRMTQTPPVIDRSPLLGEHNSELLALLGYTARETVSLAHAGVI
ncbi:MAG: CoA transferase [Chloroflexota bacterium]|nr:CoA transferase [Chloroflexota bacterium]